MSFLFQEYAIHPAKMEVVATRMANVIAVKVLVAHDASPKDEGTKVCDGKNAAVKMVALALNKENVSAHLDTMENAAKRAFLDVSNSFPA